MEEERAKMEPNRPKMEPRWSKHRPDRDCAPAFCQGQPVKSAALSKPSKGPRLRMPSKGPRHLELAACIRHLYIVNRSRLRASSLVLLESRQGTPCGAGAGTLCSFARSSAEMSGRFASLLHRFAKFDSFALAFALCSGKRASPISFCHCSTSATRLSTDPCGAGAGRLRVEFRGTKQNSIHKNSRSTASGGPILYIYI